jgi:hypothetical protein
MKGYGFLWITILGLVAAGCQGAAALARELITE